MDIMPWHPCINITIYITHRKLLYVPKVTDTHIGVIDPRVNYTIILWIIE